MIDSWELYNNNSLSFAMHQLNDGPLAKRAISLFISQHLGYCNELHKAGHFINKRRIILFHGP